MRNPPEIAIEMMGWLLLPDGELESDYSLATAVSIALCTDSRADINDVLPDPHSNNRRGWWGDLDADVIWNGWPIGSRLWLLTRSKITDSAALGGSTVSKVETYLRECLQPFVDNKICTDFTMDVERNAYDRNRIDASVVMERGTQPPVALQFQVLWAEMGLTISLG